MSYPVPPLLQLPLEPYTLGGYHFGQRLRRHVILWATHLGDDVLADPGTAVHAIGAGAVVWAEMRLGSEAKRNWGGLVVLGHRDARTGTDFFSLYGHLANLTMQVGDAVAAGQEVGRIAPGSTPENGWWKIPHLHFGIYTGPWRDEVLPGYARPEERRTKKSWWQDPHPFIDAYNHPHE